MSRSDLVNVAVGFNPRSVGVTFASRQRRLNNAECYSIVADATTIFSTHFTWVQTHGYIHSAANAAVKCVVKRIMKEKAKLTESRNDSDVEFWTNKCENLETDINTAVYELYNLTPDEVKLIENA